MIGGEGLGGAFGGDGHAGDPDDGDVGALAGDAGAAEVDEVLVAVGHLATDAVEGLVLDEDDGVLVADGGLEQAVGVGGGGGHGYEQPGDVQEERLEAVGVGGPELVAGALGHAHDERHADLPAEHVVDVGGVVDDLVEGEEGEVDGHELDDGAQPDHRGADADPDDRVLGDGGVANAPLAELLERPSVTLKAPPKTPMSSPISSTRSSRRSSSRRAALRASR